MILYMFQCHSPKSSHPLPLPQSPKDCSLYLCLFCCLAYRGIISGEVTTSSLHEALGQGGALAALRAKTVTVKSLFTTIGGTEQKQAYNYSDVIRRLFYKGPQGLTSATSGGVLKTAGLRVEQTRPTNFPSS